MFIIDDDETIKMVEGDFGIILPIEIESEDEHMISSTDSIRITIYEKINTQPIITKIYTNIENNTVEFVLNKEESYLLKAGSVYFYDIDWYSDDVFLGNLVAKNKIKIIDKAGVVDEN